MQENPFQIVVWKMAAIEFRHQCVKDSICPGERLAHLTVSVTSKGPLELPAGTLPQGNDYRVCVEHPSAVGASITFYCNPRSVGR